MHGNGIEVWHGGVGVPEVDEPLREPGAGEFVAIVRKAFPGADPVVSRLVAGLAERLHYDLHGGTGS